MLVIAVAVSAAIWVAVASRGSSATPPTKPNLAQPAQRYGDDADLMRRLERNKLVGKHEMTGLSRRELLRRGLVALAAGNVYSLVDGLAAAPARAARHRCPAPRAVPARRAARRQRARDRRDPAAAPPPRRDGAGRASSGPAKLAQAQTRLEQALVALERRYPATPAGLGVTVSWGLPYFRRLVPKLADGRRYPTYLPIDRGASKAQRKHVAAVLDATRFTSDDADGRARRATMSRSSSAATTPAHLDDAPARARRLARRPLRGAKRPQRLRRRRVRARPGARQADGARGRHPRRRPDRRRRADVPRLHLDAEGGDGARPDRELRDAARPDRPDAARASGAAARRCTSRT